MTMSREKKLLIVSLLVALGLFGANAFFLFLTREEAGAAREIATKKFAAEMEAEEVRAIERAIAESKSEQDELLAYFVNKDGAVSFIERLESTGKTAGLAISLSNVSVPKAGNVFQVDMATEGSFENTFYFLTLLEKLPYRISVEKANVRKKSAPGADSDDLQAPAVWTGSFTILLESFISA